MNNDSKLETDTERWTQKGKRGRFTQEKFRPMTEKSKTSDGKVKKKGRQV